MGDSVTYGLGVGASESWPEQLARLTGRTIYNMGLPGTGPTHHLVNLERAINLKPDLILFGFFAGNDLWDCFHHVYNGPSPPSLTRGDDVARKIIADLECRVPLLPSILSSFHHTFDPAPPAFKTAFGARRLFGIERERNRWAFLKTLALERGLDVLDDQGVKTIFATRYRLHALNLEDVRIVEGKRLAIEALRLMAREAAAVRVGFVVVLLPTKERVFSSLMRGPSADYSRLIACERQLWRELLSALAECNIQTIDALPALESASNRGIYPATADGHPTPAGHQIIAECIASHMQRKI